jgi:Protein of unknown function (DUF3892)
MSLQITCISKKDRESPHERIESIGGSNPDGTHWRLSLAEAVADIETGRRSFYVEDGGRRVRVIIAVHEARKYLKTEADGYSPDNLLSLPQCP